MTRTTAHMRLHPSFGRFKRAVLAVLILICLCLLQYATSDFSVRLVHTGYVRGNVFPVRGASECTIVDSERPQTDCVGGCARRNGYIKHVRSTDDKAIFIEGGGYYWGTVFLYFFKTRPHIECVNEAAYDIATIGGSDFYVRDLADFVEYYEGIHTSLSKPLTVTNLDFSKVAQDTSVIGRLANIPIVPYTVVTKGNVKVGFISLMSSYYASQKVPPSIEFDVGMSDLNHARVAISKMRSENNDLKVIVALVELNTLFDVVEHVKELEHVDIVLKSRALSSEVPVLIDNIYGKKVLVSPVRESGTYISDITVTFDDAGHYVGFTGGPTQLDHTQPHDSVTWNAITKYEPMSDPQYSRIVGSTSFHIYGERGPSAGSCKPNQGSTFGWGCRCFACPAGELVTKAMLDACPKLSPSGRTCDIALVNGGSIRSSINKADVSFADIVNVLPFFNSLVAFDVLGSNVRAAMVNGISTGTGAGQYPQTNIRYVVNPDLSRAVDNDHSQRIMDLHIKDSNGNWVPLEDTKKYRMVTNDYIFAGLDQFTMLVASNVEKIEEIGVEQVRVVADYFSNNNSPIRLSTAEEIEKCLVETRPPSESGCMAGYTNLLRNEYEKCPTNANFCASNSGRSILEGIFVTTACEECSGLGLCKEKACECTSGYYDQIANKVYGLVKGTPISGIFAGIQMVRGSTCSDLRTIWSLKNAEKSSMYAAAALSFVFTSIFLIMLLATCTKPIIRATAPTFSIVMCIGSFIGTIGIVLDAESLSQATCNASLWMHLVGYSVLFTSIFVKTHRIHYVFNSKLLKNRMDYTDGKVALYILILVGVEIAILGVFTGVTPLELAPVKQEERFQVALLCSSMNNTLTAVLICFNVLLMIWGVYLALRTRHVESNYNESRWIAFSIYNCAFSCIIILIVMFIVVDNVPGAAYSIKAWIVAYLCISTQAILFCPRFYLLYKGVSEVQAAGSPSSTSAVDLRSNPQSKFFVQRLRDQNQLIHERDAVVRKFIKVLKDHQLPVPEYTLRTLDDLTATTSPSAGNTTGPATTGSSGDGQSVPEATSLPTPATLNSPSNVSSPNAAIAPRRPLFGLGNHKGRPRGGGSAGFSSSFQRLPPQDSKPSPSPDEETSASDVHIQMHGIALTPNNDKVVQAQIVQEIQLTPSPPNSPVPDEDPAFTPPPPPPPPPVPTNSQVRSTPSLPLPQPPK